MHVVLESCRALLDSNNIPADSVVHLLQHILEPHQQALQQWASQLLTSQGITIEELQKKYNSHTAISELLKLVQPPVSTAMTSPPAKCSRNLIQPVTLSIEKEWDWLKQDISGTATRRKAKHKIGKVPATKRKERSRYERYMDVETFWRQISPEERRELLRVPLSTLLEGVRKDPQMADAADDLIEGLVLMKEQESLSARYWLCPACDQKLGSSKEYLKHLEAFHEELPLRNGEYVPCSKCQCDVVGMYFTSTSNENYNLCLKCYNEDVQHLSPDLLQTFEKVYPTNTNPVRAWSDTSDFISTRDSFSSLEGEYQQQPQSSTQQPQDSGGVAYMGYPEEWLKSCELNLRQDEAGDIPVVTVTAVPGNASAAGTPGACTAAGGQQLVGDVVRVTDMGKGQVSISVSGSTDTGQLYEHDLVVEKGDLQEGVMGGWRSWWPKKFIHWNPTSSSAPSNAPPVPPPCCVSPGSSGTHSSEKGQADSGRGGVSQQGVSDSLNGPQSQPIVLGQDGVSEKQASKVQLGRGQRTRISANGPSSQNIEDRGDGGGLPGEGASQAVVQYLVNGPAGDLLREALHELAREQLDRVPRGTPPGEGTPGRGGPAVPSEEPPASTLPGNDVGDDDDLEMYQSHEHVRQVVEEIMRRLREIHRNHQEIAEVSLTSVTNFVHRRLCHYQLPQAVLRDFRSTMSLVGDKPDALRSVLHNLSFKDLRMVLAYVVRQHSDALNQVVAGACEDARSNSMENSEEEEEEEEEELDEDEEEDDEDEDPEEDEEEEEGEELGCPSLFKLILPDESTFDQMLDEVWGASLFNESLLDQGAPAVVTRPRKAELGVEQEGALGVQSPGPEEPYLESHQWWLHHLTSRGVGEQTGGDVYPDQYILRWIYGNVVNVQAEDFINRLTAVKGAYDRTETILSMYEDIAFSWRELQHSTDKKNTLEEMRKNVKGTFSYLKTLEEQGGHGNKEQACEFLEAIFAGLCNVEYTTCSNNGPTGQEETNAAGSGAHPTTTSTATLAPPSASHRLLTYPAALNTIIRDPKPQADNAPPPVTSSPIAPGTSPSPAVTPSLSPQTRPSVREVSPSPTSEVSTPSQNVGTHSPAPGGVSAKTSLSNRATSSPTTLPSRSTTPSSAALSFPPLPTSTILIPVPPSRTAALYMVEGAVEVVRQHPQLAQDPTVRYARALIDRELSVLGLTEAMLVHESNSNRHELRRSEERLKKKRQELLEAEAEYSRVQAEGPANHRKRDLLDKATKEAEHREKLQDLQHKVDLAREAIQKEEKVSADCISHGQLADSELAVVQEQLRQILVRKKNLEDLMAQLEGPLPPSEVAAGSPAAPGGASSVAADMNWRAQRLECLMYRVLWCSEAIKMFSEQYIPHNNTKMYDLFLRSTNWAKTLCMDYEENMTTFMSELDNLREKLQDLACIDHVPLITSAVLEVIRQQVEAAALKAREQASLQLLKQLEEEEEARRKVAEDRSGAKSKKNKKSKDKSKSVKSTEAAKKALKTAQEAAEKAAELERRQMEEARAMREAAIEAELEKRRTELEALEQQRELEMMRAAQEASLKEAGQKCKSPPPPPVSRRASSEPKDCLPTNVLLTDTTPPQQTGGGTVGTTTTNSQKKGRAILNHEDFIPEDQLDAATKAAIEASLRDLRNHIPPPPPRPALAISEKPAQRPTKVSPSKVVSAPNVSLDSAQKARAAAVRAISASASAHAAPTTQSSDTPAAASRPPVLTQPNPPAPLFVTQSRRPVASNVPLSYAGKVSGDPSINAPSARVRPAKAQAATAGKPQPSLVQRSQSEDGTAKPHAVQTGTPRVSQHPPWTQSPPPDVFSPSQFPAISTLKSSTSLPLPSGNRLQQGPKGQPGSPLPHAPSTPTPLDIGIPATQTLSPTDEEVEMPGVGTQGKATNTPQEPHDHSVREDSLCFVDPHQHTFNPFAENPLHKALVTNSLDGMLAPQAPLIPSLPVSLPAYRPLGVSQPPISSPSPFPPGLQGGELMASSPTCDPDHILSIMAILEPDSQQAQLHQRQADNGEGPYPGEYDSCRDAGGAQIPPYGGWNGDRVPGPRPNQPFPGKVDAYGYPASVMMPTHHPPRRSHKDGADGHASAKPKGPRHIPGPTGNPPYGGGSTGVHWHGPPASQMWMPSAKGPPLGVAARPVDWTLEGHMSMYPPSQILPPPPMQFAGHPPIRYGATSRGPSPTVPDPGMNLGPLSGPRDPTVSAPAMPMFSWGQGLQAGRGGRHGNQQGMRGPSWSQWGVSEGWAATGNEWG